MLSIRTYAAVALPLALVASAAVSAPAFASGGGDPSVSGTCSQGSHWKLKAGPDDGRLEVEFEVDSNKVGQRWTWRLLNDGALVARGAATTTATSGSFSVERKIANTPGADVVRFRATQPGTGETCTGTLRVA